MFDPTAPDTPHLEGVQPTWRDLGFACELTHVVWERRQTPWSQIEPKLYGRAGENKISQTIVLLKKLDILDKEYRVSINGVWLANNFKSTPQTTISQGIELGTKDDLSEVEQTIFCQILFQYDCLPMLAALDLISTQSISDKETEKRALSFKGHVSHLEKYDSEWEIGTWKKKSQVHFEWAKRTGLASANDQGNLELTQLGEAIDNTIDYMYHPEW